MVFIPRIIFRRRHFSEKVKHLSTIINGFHPTNHIFVVWAGVWTGFQPMELLRPLFQNASFQHLSHPIMKALGTWIALRGEAGPPEAQETATVAKPTLQPSEQGSHRSMRSIWKLFDTARRKKLL